MIKRKSPVIYLLVFLLFAPLLHADDSVFDVTDYSSYNTDPGDDSPMFRYAFAAAKAYVASTGNPATVEIPEDTYYVAPTSGSAQCFYVGSAEKLTIKGVPTATIVVTQWDAHAFVIGESKDVTVENLIIDYDPLPHTQGTITSVDEANEYLYVDIDSGFPVPTDTQFSAGKVWCYYHTDGVIDNSLGDDRVSGFQHITGQSYRMTSWWYSSTDLVGKKFVLSPRGATDGSAFLIKGSQMNEDPSNPGEHLDSIVMNNITIHSSPTLGFQVRSNSGVVKIKNCVIEPASGRLHSTNADGIHAKWNRAPLKIINCDFSGMGDDATNIAGSYQSIIEQTASNVIYVDRHASYKVGDTMEVYNPENAELLATATVTNVHHTSWAGQYATKLTLSSNLPTLSTEDALGSGRSDPDVSICTATLGAGTQIINSNFGAFRGRAIMQRAPNMLVEGNIFYQQKGPAIVLGPDFGWMEGKAGSGAIIRNNTFDDVSQTNIEIAPIATGSAETVYSTEDIIIEGNLFTNYGKGSINGRGSVGEVLGVDRAQNIVFNYNIIGERHPDIDPSNIIPQVSVRRSSDISLLHNDVYDATEVDDWLAIVGTDVELVNISNTVFSENVDYASETELDNAWTYAASLGGNPLRLGTSSSISADQPYIMLGNAAYRRDLDMEITSDWVLSFDMLHSDPSRRGFVGLLDDSRQYGYIVLWDSGPSNGSEGFVSIRKVDLASPFNSWYEKGSQLAIGASGHKNTTTPMAHIELEWIAETGELIAYVDGVEVASATDTEFYTFSKVIMSGNGSGTAGDAVYIDNIHVSTLDIFRDRVDYASETELDNAWDYVHSLGGNPFRLGTDSGVSADQPYIMIGNCVYSRDLDIPVQADWQLSFDMMITDSTRRGMVGLLDAEGQHGYLVLWDSGVSTNGYIKIKKMDLGSPWNSWYETGTQLTSVDSGAAVKSAPLKHIDFTWDSDTGTLALWVDGTLKSTTIDTDFNSFAKLYISGNGAGAAGDAVYIDNLQVSTLTD